MFDASIAQHDEKFSAAVRKVLFPIANGLHLPKLCVQRDLSF